VIAVLPGHVIDQIAAGEVIERPASVVKELVDNAIDAGAKAIAIDTRGGGRALVRVTDDGSGMSPANARLALERHATSKLRGVDDLWGLATLGFRGEALPAIASVSKMTLTTRRAADLAATRIVIEAGRVASVGEAGAAPGTTVEIVDLLANQPARLKFLKADATEASHITDLVSRVAMAHPELHLRLRHNGRTALELPPDRDGFSRAQALLGPRVAARMIEAIGEEAGVRVTAYLADPELAQTTARGVQLYIGRRPVRDRGLLHAVAMGYGELVPRGRYPIAIVLVDVPGGAVDLNVHPQKLEVRFADAASVCAAVRHVVQAGVARAGWQAVGGVQMMTAIASVAPPRLPFDGGPTPLAQHYAEQLRASRDSGQRSFGFGTPRDADTPREWVRELRRELRVAETRDSVRVTQPAVADSPGLIAAMSRGVSGGDATSSRILSSPAGASTGPISGGGGSPAGASTTPVDAAWVATSQTLLDAAQAALDSLAAVDASTSRAATPSGPISPISTSRTSSHRERMAIPTLRDEVIGESFDESPTAVADVRRGLVVHFHPAIPDVEVPAELADGSGPVVGFFGALRYLGQLDLTYLVCEGDRELVLVDQHAAHERVELARLKDRYRSCDVPIQKMLFPVTIDVAPAQLELAARLGGVLAEVGFEVEPFGGGTLAIKAVPAGIRHGDPTQLLRRLLDDWQSDGAPSEHERLERVLAEIACHSVVRAGDRLSPSEAEALLRALDATPQDAAGHTGHLGRPMLMRLPIGEIARRFGR